MGGLPAQLRPSSCSSSCRVPAGAEAGRAALGVAPGPLMLWPRRATLGPRNTPSLLPSPRPLPPAQPLCVLGALGRLRAQGRVAGAHASACTPVGTPVASEGILVRKGARGSAKPVPPGCQR